MAVTLFLLGILLTGLVLLAVGMVVLLKTNNKLAGWVVTAVGGVFVVFSIAVYLFLAISTSTMG